MCKKIYFSHDCDARNDERVTRLRIRYGAAGYGIYFMLLELLQAAPEYTLETDYKALAFDLRVPACRIKTIVEQSGLFVVIDDGRRFYSERLARDMGEQEKLEQRRAEAARIGAEARWNAPEGMRIASKTHANRIENVCESHSEAACAKTEKEKEEEREKEKDFPPLIPPYIEKEKEKEEEKEKAFVPSCACARAHVCEGDCEAEASEIAAVNTPADAVPPAGAEHIGTSAEPLQPAPAEAVEEVAPAEVAAEGEKKPARTPMKRPTLEEVKACIAERGYHVDAEAFISFYESNGWKVGKNPMKSWRAALVTWEKRHTPSNTANPINQNAYGQGFTKTLAEQRRDRNNQDCADFFARKMAEINAYDMARRAAAAESL
ncbi:hypothetical protein BHU09_08680 [Tannerella sp. oral taxon 808]|nr:hypothetical protein BHU09_08680 [Tannerella sp. oral taxon 808]